MKGRFMVSNKLIYACVCRHKDNFISQAGKSYYPGLIIFVRIKKRNRMKKLENRKWKVLKSEYLFKRPWFTVREEEVEVANGKIIPEYYVLEYPDWVNTIAITRDKQCVMVSQYRHGLGQTNFELCSGVMDPEDPSPLYAAQRELLEETGYGNGNWQQLMVISANPSTMNNLTYCFLATDVEKVSEQHLDESEDLKVHLLSLDEVKEILFNDGIKQSLNAAPLWKYMAQNHL